MQRCEKLYEESRHCNEKTKLLLLEISRSSAASETPALADRVSLIRDRFQELCEDIEDQWREYEAMR
jgi:hypothetical protein